MVDNMKNIKNIMLSKSSNMMSVLRKVNLILGIFILLTSCEKEISIDLPQYETKVVIEGSIETGEFAVVTITKSTDYFQVYDSATIANMFVRNALVTVSNQFGSIDTLTFAFDITQPLPFVYKGSTIIGQEGGIYTLKVQVDNKTYTTSTSILPAVTIDSLFFVEQNMDEHKGIIRMKFTDPLGARNYYRLFSKVLGKDSSYTPVWGGATFDDKLIDGISYFADIYRGDKSNLMQENTHGDPRLSRFFGIGDTVVVKMSSIDYYTYKFWYSAEMEMNSGGNPFTTPSPINSNIPNALGIWGGYGVFYDTIIIANPLKK